MGPLAVRPALPGRRRGDQSCAPASAWLRRRGARTLGLETMPRTVENIGFYSRLGFVPGHLTVTLVRELEGRPPSGPAGGVFARGRSRPCSRRSADLTHAIAPRRRLHPRAGAHARPGARRHHHPRRAGRHAARASRSGTPPRWRRAGRATSCGCSSWWRATCRAFRAVLRAVEAAGDDARRGAAGVAPMPDRVRGCIRGAARRRVPGALDRSADDDARRARSGWRRRAS